MIFRPAAAGTYSIALHAAKGVPDAGVSGGLMPPMFAARRLPATPQMLFSAMMPQCISAVSTDAAYGTATAFVAAEPTDLGTDWGSYDYSPVGFTLRNSAGEMQPVSFSPLPGLSDSKVKAGRTVEAHFNIGITAGTWADALADRSLIYLSPEGLCKYKSGSSQSSFIRSTRSPMKELEKVPKEMKGSEAS